MHNDLPSRSADGLAALDLFYSNFNDLNFFVEDTEQENLYETILTKLFSNYKITRIFPLGGKTAVLKHAADPQNKASAGKNIYILDKDFDDFLGKISNTQNVYYLERYCIENYLIEEAAICELVVEHHPRKKRPEISSTLNIPKTFEDIISELRNLFLLFYCSQLFELGIKNCSSKAEEFGLRNKLWQLDDAKVSSYWDSIIDAAKNKGLDPILADPENDPRLVSFLAATAHARICGKFMLAMIFHYVKSKYNLGSITFESFAYRLAKNSSLDSLSNLRAKISRDLDNAEVHLSTEVTRPEAIAS